MIHSMKKKCNGQGVMGVAWLILFLAGCAPSLSYVVPEDLILRLPKNARRGVFQAETVVTIAVDKKSSIKRDADSTLREIDRTREKIAQVEKQASKAGDREADKMELEIKMLKSKIDYLERLVEHQEIRAKLAEKELLHAMAQFELEKAKVVKKHAMVLDDAVEDFERQVKDMQAEVDDFKKEVDQDAAELKEEENRWLAVKKEYYSSVGESSKGWWTE
jgi:hypothetical protein